MNSRRWFIGLMVLGLTCAAWGLCALRETDSFCRRAIRTDALVTYLDRRLPDSDTEIRPIDRASEWAGPCFKTVVFKQSDGRQVVWQAPFSVRRSKLLSLSNQYAVPEDRTASVLYEAGRAMEFRFDAFASLWLGGLLALIFGLLLLGLATATGLGVDVPQAIMQTGRAIKAVLASGSATVGSE